MKTIIKILLIGLFLALIGLGLISCGSRKVHKEITNEVTHASLIDNSITEKQSESNIKKVSNVKIDDKNQTITEETTYTPSDPTKESFVIEKDGTKVILGNAKKTVRKTTQNNNTATSKEILQVETQKEAVKEQKAIKQVNTSKKENSVKNVDKKQFNPFNLIWIGSLIFLVLYIIYRVYKKLPLVPKF